MQNPMLGSLALLDMSGLVLLGAIVATLVASLLANAAVHRRYAALSRVVTRLASGGADPADVPTGVLARILREVVEARRRHGGEVNTQAIIEESFHKELRGVLAAERFVKAATGLVIILGLMGTLYGNTLSIGKLVGLVGANGAGAEDLTEALTRGLTDALRGMSVAFVASFTGVASAVVLTVANAVANVGERRVAAMVEIEGYVDNVVLGGEPVGVGGASQAMTEAFAASVAQLDEVVARFDHSLRTFAASTRDFQEFNHHLKDNVQRMSLGFGDMSDALRAHAAAFSPPPRERR